MVLVGLGLLLASPLVVMPGLAQPHLWPKMLVASIGLVLILLGPRRTKLDPPVAWCIAALASVLLLAALAAEDPVASLLGRYPRYEGVPIAGVYVGALVAGARLRAWPSAWRLWLPRVLAPVSALMLISSVANLTSADADRVGSLLGSASILGSWAALVSVLLLGLSMSPGPPGVKVDRWLAPTGMLFSLLALVISASRAAALGWAVGVVMVSVLTRPVRRQARIIWFALAGGAVVAAVLLPSSLGRLAGTAGIAQSTASGRLLLWQDSLSLVRTHPVLGVGPSGFVDSIPPFHSVQWAEAVGPANPPDSPHSLVLQLLVAGGLLALVAAAVVAVLGTRSLVRTWGRDRGLLVPVVAAAAAYGASLLFGFTDPVVTTLASLLLGFAVAVPVRDEVLVRDPWGRAQRVAPAVAVAGVGVLCFGGIVTERALADGFEALEERDAVAAGAAFAMAATASPWGDDVALRAGHALRVSAEAGLVQPAHCREATERARLALPGSVEVALDAAVCAELAGEWPAAWAHVESARALDPTNVDVWLERGVIAALGGQPAEAEASWRRAVQLRPATQQAWVNLAQLYEQLGRSEDAADAVRAAQEITGTSGS